MLSGQLRPKSGKAAVLGLDIAHFPKQVQAPQAFARRVA